jgi:two-component system, NtrC family, nitrogen regulation sensor histidine kinase GlnL
VSDSSSSAKQFFSAEPITPERRKARASLLAGLDWLATSVVLLDSAGNTLFINQAAAQLFELSRKENGQGVIGRPFAQQFANGSLIDSLLEDASNAQFGQRRQELFLERLGRLPLRLLCTAVALDDPIGTLLLEFFETEQQTRLAREENLAELANANREMVRNLAHEIKNPLGGIRGAAQLLETELVSSGQKEYTQVIIKEAGRLQNLVDRLLAPHRRASQRELLNIHEVCERVRLVSLSQYPQGLRFVRDYDASIPEFVGDREHLIQVVLNLVQNAIQAMKGEGEIRLRTRIVRQVVIARVHFKLALELHVIDNGPGVPDEIRSRLFFPLVSGREGGSGLGLSLAQSFVQQHGGLIEFESVVGRTDFKVLLPIILQ